MFGETRRGLPLVTPPTTHLRDWCVAKTWVACHVSLVWVNVGRLGSPRKAFCLAWVAAQDKGVVGCWTGARRLARRWWTLFRHRRSRGDRGLRTARRRCQWQCVWPGQVAAAGSGGAVVGPCWCGWGLATTSMLRRGML